CMNYEKNIGKTNGYKSFHECEQKCKNKISLSLNKSENFKQIDCHCAKDCKTETYYFDLLESHQKIIQVNDEINIIIKRDNREEHIYHLPLISFTKYLCSLGEIMSMWIGISFFGEGKTILDLFSAFIKSRIKQETKVAYYKRMFKYIHLLFLALCLSLSSLQTYNTFLQYFNYSYIVRVSSDVQLIFPSIKIEHYMTFSSPTFKNLFKVKNLEERKRTIEEYFNASFSVSCELKQNNQTIMSCDQYYSQRNEYYNWANWNINKIIIMENGGREEVRLMRERNRTTKRDFKMNIEGKPNININLRLPKLSEKILSLFYYQDYRYSEIFFIGGAIGQEYDLESIEKFAAFPNRHTYV